MKHQWKQRLGALLLAAAMLSSNGVIFAENIGNSAKDTKNIKDQVLFSTSFEDGENGDLLESTLDGDHLSNVIHTDYLSQGKGLPILYETVKGSPDYVGSECKYNLFDGKTGSKYLSSGSKIFVSFKLEQSAVVRSYDLASANDEPGRDPSAWTLYGSDDGENWVALDARTGVNFTSRQQTKKFGFDNETAYSWYKLEVTANKGASLTQFSDLLLYSEVSENKGDGIDDPNAVKVKPDSIKGMEELGYNPSQNKAALFDGSMETKFISAAPTGFISVQLTKAVVLTEYKLGSGDDWPERDPKSWVLYGSTDGETWVKLDEQNDFNMSSRNKLYTFTFENTVAYDHYKLDITKNGGKDGTNRDIIQFSEWQFVTTETASVASYLSSTTEPTKVAKVDRSKIQSNHGTMSDIYKIFDGDLGTKMCAFDTRPLVITWELDKAEVAVQYAIISGNDAPARDPKDWVLYGSVDGENWVALDTQNGNSFAERETEYVFEIENETAYSFYKWEIAANQGVDSWGHDIIQLQEFKLVVLGEEEVSNEVQMEIEEIQGSLDVEGGEGLGKLFDNSVGTKVCKVGVTSFWVSVQLTKPAAVNMYKIGSASDQEKRDPKEWVLYGSTDGENWVKLDEQTDADLPERDTLYTFNIDNTVEYSYYKLDVLSNNETDDFGLDIVAFSEWQLFVVDGEGGTEDDPDVPVEPDEPEVDPNVPTVDTEKVQASAALKGGEGFLNIFDGKTDTKVCVSGKTQWVSFALKNALVIKGYTLVSANDHLTRSPKAWTFYGSADGENWVKLDEQSGIDFEDYFEAKTFAFDNKTAYLYYKLDITENGGNDYTQFSELALLTDVKLPEEDVKPEGMVSKPVFGPIGTDCNYPGAWTGMSCLGVYGQQTDKKNTYARNVIFDGLSIPVTENTKLSYVIFPGLFDVNKYDYEYTSCRVIIDLRFSDGTYLSDLGAIDQYGSEMSPDGQVAGECLYTLQWNYIESYIGDVAKGKTIEKILVYFDMDEAVDASRFITFFDDLKIEDKAPVVYEHLSDYINILRGTNNDIAFSRGMCTPGVTVPGGFNFLTPVTNSQSPTLPYTYQQNGENSPLDSISFLHAPNFWIGSYGSFQFMANTSVDTSNGTAGISSAQISSSARQSKFTHQNESAKAHEYTVTLNEGTAASGVTIEVTATTHAAYVRFTFPEGSDNVNVIFDSLWGSGNLKLAEDGKSFTASTSHGTTMYVYGEFDTAYASASVINRKQGIVAFPEGTTTVTMKMATSNISSNQAKHNLELEVGTKNYDSVFAAAQKEWDELCGIFEIEGATYNQLVSFYSSLYRLYAFPSLYSENEGTNEKPVWVYASPHNSGKKTSGILYTNNGFWDTYRTAWGAYALFTPSRDTNYLNGMVQHYTETGWVPRWLGPGAVNCMVGTSSDIIFADAYLKGVEFNYAQAWKSMLKSASAYSDNMTAGGRKENNTAPFAGYIANDRIVGGKSEFVGEAYSSSIEGYINDYGLYRMAEAMGLEDEAEYYYSRCLKYALLYNVEQGFFMGKSTAGVWSCGKNAFNPAAWNGPMYDFTESVGWNYAFPAVFDGAGMTTLHGGAEKLAEKLNQMFDDSYTAMKNVVELGSVHHEIAEFKEVKMGQYMHSNQPSHHVIYTYAFSSEPYRVQQYTREVLRHVYVGSELGQGYPGDEDNGEMSGWYVFNALGFYPYSMGSNEYMIGSPLFDKVTIHLENGKDIVIVANNNSDENVYIQSAKLNGKAYDNMYLKHEDLVAGCTIEFEMGSEPSNWGSGKPTSLTEAGKSVTFSSDLTKEKGIQMTGGIAGIEKVIDNNSLTYTNIGNGSNIILSADAKHSVSMITLASSTASKAPTGFILEGSDDMTNWTKLDERSNIKWEFDNYVQPFAVPTENRGEYQYYRVTFTGGSELSEIEFMEAIDQSSAGSGTKPVDPDNSDDPKDPDNPGDLDPEPAIDNEGMPVWAIALIAVVAALAVGAVVFVVLKKKKQ